MSLDPFATIRGTCPVDYAIDDALIEFHFGSASHGIHITFDTDALRNLMTLGSEALDKQTRRAEHVTTA